MFSNKLFDVLLTMQSLSEFGWWRMKIIYKVVSRKNVWKLYMLSKKWCYIKKYHNLMWCWFFLNKADDSTKTSNLEVLNEYKIFKNILYENEPHLINFIMLDVKLWHEIFQFIIAEQKCIDYKIKNNRCSVRRHKNVLSMRSTLSFKTGPRPVTERLRLKILSLLETTKMRCTMLINGTNLIRGSKMTLLIANSNKLQKISIYCQQQWYHCEIWFLTFLRQH